MKRTLLFFFSFFCVSFEAQATPKLYTTANPINQGDVNQVEGVMEALEELSEKKTPSQFIDARHPDIVAKKIMEDLAQDQKVILIGAGEGGLNALKKLNPDLNLIVCLTSHQFLDGYKDLSVLEKVDFIALPFHVSSQDKKRIGRKLISTVGVAHNRQVTQVEKAYEKWKKDLPLAGFYLAVILGGDAPLPDGSIKWFTEEDVEKLAKLITPLAKGNKASVIVLNGPRTGKYDKNQKERLSVHRDGKSDPISQRFLQVLKEQGIPATFFDFQHKSEGKKAQERPYNTFDLVVGAIRAHKGLLVIPGESTSMISEAVDLLPPDKIMVYRNGAMNENHDHHIHSEWKAGRVAILDAYKVVLKPETARTSEPSAAKVIAKVIMDEKQKRWRE